MLHNALEDVGSHFDVAAVVVALDVSCDRPVRCSAEPPDALGEIGDPRALGPLEEVENTIIDAFDTWVDMADLPLRFSFVRGICDTPGYRKGEANLNCIMVLDDYWDEGSDPGATAVVSHGAWSGHIMDADIVFNLDLVSNIDELGAKMDRVRNVALHEVGHVLGLSHTDFPNRRVSPSIPSSSSPIMNTSSKEVGCPQAKTKERTERSMWLLERKRSL